MPCCFPATAISAAWWSRCSAAGVRVSVVSTLRSQPPMVADELRRQADTFIELSELMAQIQRSERREGSAPAGPDRFYQESEAS